MALEKANLDNGLTLYVDRVPGSMDNNVTMFVPYGSVNEEVGEEGVAHVFEHCVHLETDEFKDRQDLRRYTQVNGMSTNANTYYTRTQYYAHGLELEPNINYLSQILQNTHFPEEAVEHEMLSVRREAKTRLDYPGLLHFVSAQNAMFGHPYGRDAVGYHDKLDFEAETLKRLHERYYKLGNMALVVTGAAKFDEVAKLAERYFVADEEEYVDTRGELHQTFGEHLRTGYALENANNVQVTVAYPMTPEFFEKYTQNSLAYNVASRAMADAAFQALRYDRGISYDGSVGFSTVNHPNAWSIDGDVSTDAENVASAEEAFQEIFSRDSSKYSDDEIDGTLAMYRYELLKKTSTAGGRSAMHLGRLEAYRDPVDAAGLKRQLKKLTPADVRATIDDIVEHAQNTPRYTHLTGTRKDIGEVERVVEQSEII